jgi:hypothetical protein
MSLSSIPITRRNSLSDELEAMAVIGRALDSLGDPAAQQRVLHWAADRLRVETPSTVEVATPGRKDPNPDVEGLHDLFDNHREITREGLKLVPNPAV